MFIHRTIYLHIGTNHLMGDSETKFKEADHLVLPVATPLPHHHSHNSIKSGYQHDVLNSASGLHPTSIGGVGSVSDGGGGSLQATGLNGSSGLDKYGDMSSLHLAHNRFLMPTSAASDPMKASDMHHFTTSATNPFSIHRFLPGGNLTDPKDVVSHYDYSQLGQTNSPGTVPHSVSQGFGHAPHESMYYPPPLYPVHHASTSVHSTHHL